MRSPGQRIDGATRVELSGEKVGVSGDGVFQAPARGRHLWVDLGAVSISHALFGLLSSPEVGISSVEVIDRELARCLSTDSASIARYGDASGEAVLVPIGCFDQHDPAGKQIRKRVVPSPVAPSGRDEVVVFGARVSFGGVAGKSVDAGWVDVDQGDRSIAQMLADGMCVLVASSVLAREVVFAPSAKVMARNGVFQAVPPSWSNHLVFDADELAHIGESKLGADALRRIAEAKLAFPGTAVSEDPVDTPNYPGWEG